MYVYTWILAKHGYDGNDLILTSHRCVVKRRCHLLLYCVLNRVNFFVSFEKKGKKLNFIQTENPNL